MKTQDLEHLTKEQLQEILCDFYNSIDKTFLNLRNSKESSGSFIKMELMGDYLHTSKKLLDKIKK